MARTEAANAVNRGALEGYRQSGVNPRKSWLSAYDDETRDSHKEAHDRYRGNPIPLDEDFQVGNSSGPCPGSVEGNDSAAQNINCRCCVLPIVE